MSYNELCDLLQSMFAEANASNGIKSPDELWSTYSDRINTLLDSPDPQDAFVKTSKDVILPRAAEAMRMLQFLRQRFGENSEGRRLVGRIRAEAILRNRPTRDVPSASLLGRAKDTASLTTFPAFSQFNIDGWEAVSDAISKHSGLIIEAPTGSGKTETFLLPLINSIATALRDSSEQIPRFIIIYPRVALLKDQLSRVFQYVYQAESLLNGKSGTAKDTKRITIGFQFGGVLSEAKYTLENRDIFAADRTFRLVEKCPTCGKGTLRAQDRRHKGILDIQCDNESCRAKFGTSISKKDHAITQPHLLITTVESLDRLYLNPSEGIEHYLDTLTGIVMDEVHLYHSLYGVHIYNLIRRIESLRSGKELTKIGLSATVSNAARFAAKLFYGDESRAVNVHTTNDEKYTQVPAGIEIVFFLQAPEEGQRSGAAPTLIQSIMAMGHSVLRSNERLLAFVDSRDNVMRFGRQLRDAESSQRLWRFRCLPNNIHFGKNDCPHKCPEDCRDIYFEGECWRGMLGGTDCYKALSEFRDRPLDVTLVTGQERSDFSRGDAIISTPALEVGVDDSRIKSTVHYRPPRSVFSFIQRRGRAGRGGDVAYTLMILGNDASDHFYFFRRHRLIYGSYELPLNPDNLVVAGMHDRLDLERHRLFDCMEEARSVPEGIWHWVWSTLSSCKLLRHYYGEKLFQPFEDKEQRIQKAVLRSFAKREQERFSNYMSLQWLLREIRDELPGELGSLSNEVLAAINGYLENSTPSKDEVKRRLLELHQAIGKACFDNLELADNLRLIQDKILEVWTVIEQRAGGVTLKHAECLYDFFRKLSELFDTNKRYTLNTAPDVLKIVLQSLFYLHLGLDETDEPDGCVSRVDYFIPDAYFNEVKPIVVELRDETPGLPFNPDLRNESITSLSTSLIPYKTTYMYGGDTLWVVDTDHSPAWVDGDSNEVGIALSAEGTHIDGILIPQKVYVKPLRSDDKGTQVVKMCPQCYALYSLNRQQKCCAELQAVKVYAEAITKRGYHADALHQESRTIDFLEKLYGSTTVYGSEVIARRATLTPNAGYVVNYKNVFKQFRALYTTPVRYGLPTKGIRWRLDAVVETLMEDDSLREKLETISIGDTNKRLDTNIILHTAAHILHRTVASISGVNEQVLEYSTSEEAKEVVVWERYEGGAGITEIFVDKMHGNPLDVYRELLSSVVCPVDLAERDDWQSRSELASSISKEWKLSTDDELVLYLASEAEAERAATLMQESSETRLVCRPPQGTDGCPACIYTTYCIEREEQPLAVSRLVAEVIIKSMIRKVSTGEYERLEQEAQAGHRLPPIRLSEASDEELFILDF